MLGACLQTSAHSPLSLSAMTKQNIRERMMEEIMFYNAPSAPVATAAAAPPAAAAAAAPDAAPAASTSAAGTGHHGGVAHAAAHPAAATESRPVSAPHSQKAAEVSAPASDHGKCNAF